MGNYFGFLLIILVFLFANAPISSSQDFDIRGRVHMDAFIGLNNADDFQNGFNNRRARLGVNGQVIENWDGRIEVDFADGGVSPNDFRLRRRFSDGSRLWIGQYKVPQGLNELTSSNNITFIERATNSNMIADSRRMGLAYERFGRALGFKSMIFGRALGQRGDITGDMPLGGAFRGVFAPEIGSGRLHIGGSVVYESLMDQTIIGFSDRPEARDSGGGKSLIGLQINTPDLEGSFKSGLELALMHGPLSLEAEYLMVNVLMDEGDSPLFHGWHVQSNYVLTGESRAYSSGGFGTITPQNGRALEIATRFSHMNLNDSGYMGGKQSNLTLALNCYLASNLRFMANVIFVDISTRGNGTGDRTPVIGVLRSQFHF